MSNATLRTCAKGHQYYKSSDCPTCPVCEKKRKPEQGFMSKLPAPARRALERERIDVVEKLANYSRKEILALHGVGPGSIPKLEESLNKKGLTFKT